MDDNTFNLNNKIYSNNNVLLQEVVEDLFKLMDYSKDNLILETLASIIDKINYIINKDKKNLDLTRNDINTLQNKLDNININIKTNQLIKVKDGTYIGEVVNGVAEGKGICYFINGDRYEGNMKNNIKEGKGIYYFNDGNRYEGDFRNGIKEGKGIFYYKVGDIYEGDFKNDTREGRGIYYYNNGIREMGDYHNGYRTGKQVALTPNGEIIVNNY